MFKNFQHKVFDGVNSLINDLYLFQLSLYFIEFKIRVWLFRLLIICNSYFIHNLNECLNIDIIVLVVCLKDLVLFLQRTNSSIFLFDWFLILFYFCFIFLDSFLIFSPRRFNFLIGSRKYFSHGFEELIIFGLIVRYVYPILTY